MLKKIQRFFPFLRPRSNLKLSKPSENPIISPLAENDWESWQTFNPAAIYLDGRVHFLYRAIGEDGISRLGYASSKDGIHIGERLKNPVFSRNPAFSQLLHYNQ